MKPKSALILLALVAAIIAGIAAFEWELKPRQEAKEQTAAVLFPTLDPDKVNRIEITQGDTAIFVVRGGDTAWKVETAGGYPADQDAVKNLLSTLKELKEGVLSAQNKDNFKKLGVDDKGLRVKVKQDQDPLADLFVGIAGKGYGTTFVRKPDSDKVFMVADDINVPKSSAAWRDKMIFSIPAENLEEITLTTYGQTAEVPPRVLHLRRNPVGEWELASGGTAEKPDPSKADALARSLGELRAADFADQVSLESAGLAPPTRAAEFRLVTGEVYTLQIGKLTGAKGDARYYVKRSDLGVVLQVYEYTVNNIFKTPEALRPLPGVPEGQNPSSFLPAPNLGAPPAVVPPGLVPGAPVEPAPGVTATPALPAGATVKPPTPPAPPPAPAPGATAPPTSPPEK